MNIKYVLTAEDFQISALPLEHKFSSTNKVSLTAIGARFYMRPPA